MVSEAVPSAGGGETDIIHTHRAMNIALLLWFTVLKVWWHGTIVYPGIHWPISQFLPSNNKKNINENCKIYILYFIKL